MYEWYEENIYVVDCGFGCLVVCLFVVVACLLLYSQSPVALCRRLSCVLYGAPDPPVRHDGVAWRGEWQLSLKTNEERCARDRGGPLLPLTHVLVTHVALFQPFILGYDFGGGSKLYFVFDPTSQHRTYPCCDITTTTTTTTTSAKDNPNLRNKKKVEVVVL